MRRKLTRIDEWYLQRHPLLFILTTVVLPLVLIFSGLGAKIGYMLEVRTGAAVVLTTAGVAVSVALIGLGIEKYRASKGGPEA
jgi:NhaP-type Na+/H+ and K+/H+ antiporter